MADSKIILSKDLMDKVVEELTEYRAIGTVEGYELAIQSSIENYNLYREYKAKVQQYEAIGTVEELQSMKEKNDTLRALYEDARKEGSHLIAKEKAAAVDEFLHNAETKICDRILQNQARLDFASGLSVANRIIDEIAEQMKAGAENE